MHFLFRLLYPFQHSGLRWGLRVRRIYCQMSFCFLSFWREVGGLASGISRLLVNLFPGHLSVPSYSNTVRIRGEEFAELYEVQQKDFINLFRIKAFLGLLL